MVENRRICSECRDTGPWSLRREHGRLVATCEGCRAELLYFGIVVEETEATSMFLYTNAPDRYDYMGVVIGSNDLGVVEGHPCRTWNGPWRLVETDDNAELVRQQMDRYQSGLYGVMRSRLFEEDIADYLNDSEVGPCAGTSTMTVSLPT